MPRYRPTAIAILREHYAEDLPALPSLGVHNKKRRYDQRFASAWQLLRKYLTGMKYQQIGDSLTPKLSRARVQQIIDFAATTYLESVGVDVAAIRARPDAPVAKKRIGIDELLERDR